MIRKKPLIGIIDDDKIYQFMLDKIINDNELAERVVPFFDGEKAIQYLRDNYAKIENIPDILFLDVNMPIMDGWQFMEEYASIQSNIKKKIVIFMLSSSVNPVDVERADKISEISNYIVKPIKLLEVKKIFNNLKIFSGL
jgi:CheY-like chemotaxis protein